MIVLISEFYYSPHTMGCKINVNIIDHSEHRALAMIEFTDQNDQLIARIDNYECVIDASLEEAFSKNKLHKLSVN
ncbi:MAG: hypothetical protein DRQ58_08545 [Gammaproteobacteria bacterium]|nr:MAG: hypothetical protein DRQ58_08545 [Gammaproteobacteria bacterium]